MKSTYYLLFTVNCESIWFQMLMLLNVSKIIVVMSVIMGFALQETKATYTGHVQHCGTGLANALQRICIGRGFNQMQKRSRKF